MISTAGNFEKQSWQLYYLSYQLRFVGNQGAVSMGEMQGWQGWQGSALQIGIYSSRSMEEHSLPPN